MATKRKAARAASRSSRAKVGPVNMLLNGQSVGQTTPTPGQSIGEVANQIAKDHSLKSYSILVNGVKVSAEEAGRPLLGAKTIEVFAKETRG